MSVRTFRSRSERQTVEFGAALAKELAPGSLVLLIGSLGAGKTTLAKGIAAGLGAATEDEVTSPTFTLIHEYCEPPRLYHIDLYRLDEARQLAALGLEEILDTSAVVLVEWGERFPEFWPPERLEIRLRRLRNEDREIEIQQRKRAYDRKVMSSGSSGAGQ